MSEGLVEMTNPVDHSVGGMKGHILRRAIHLGIAGVPWLYFKQGENIGGLFSLEPIHFVSYAMIALVIFEAVRLKLGFTVFGQRDYESKQVSALAWGGLAIGISLLALREPEFAYPLIISLAIGDPLLGELRRAELSAKITFTITTLVLLGIWIGYAVWFETSLVMAVILAPICVAAEYPRLRFIDDNATMIFIPLMVILILIPLVS